MIFNDTLFFDSYFTEENGDKYITYRSGMMVYEEGLVDGFFISTGYNGAGFVPQTTTRPAPERLKASSFANKNTFSLSFDGQTLYSHWKWVDYSTDTDDKGMVVTVKLENTKRPFAVAVKTRLDGTGVITRWLEIENKSGALAAMSGMSVMSGGLVETKRPSDHMKNGENIWRLGYMNEPNQIFEGIFKWQDIPKNSGAYISGRFAQGRYRHPMFVLENKAMGQCFIGQLAYSGGYKFDFLSNEPALFHKHSMNYLSFDCSIEGVAPLYVLEKGETLSSPEFHFGMMYGGLDVCVNEMHRHIRHSVMKYEIKEGHESPIEAGIGPEVGMDQEDIIAFMDNAAKIGCEIVFLDASWYAQKGKETNWAHDCGNWTPDVCRYEIGIEGLRDHCHSKGMKFGLWMEPERIGKDCPGANDMIDMYLRGYDDKVRGGIEGGENSGMLDLGRPSAAKWVEEQIVSLIERYDLDFFRLDHNGENQYAFSFNERGGYNEHAEMRYINEWYAIFDRLRERFPNVIFENCASGGGRTDLGMVSRVSHTWVTDWQIAPRSFAIINGMSMCLPPEYLDRLMAGQTGHTNAELDFQARLMLFGRPTVGTVAPPELVVNPIHSDRVTHTLNLYKKYVRPIHATGSLVFHHTPEVDAVDPRGNGILELAASDGSASIIGIFQLSDPSEQDKQINVRFKGVDIGAEYLLTTDNDGRSAKVSGYELKNRGVHVELSSALTTELLIAKKL